MITILHVFTSYSTDTGYAISPALPRFALTISGQNLPYYFLWQVI